MPVLNKAYESLDERMKPIVLEILQELEKRGWQPKVAEGRRSAEQQREKVRLGYSQTMNSYHLSGLAADIIDTRHAWNIPLTHQFWVDLGDIVNRLHVPEEGRIRWGGTWDRPYSMYLNCVKNKQKIAWFADVAHVELRL
jgi:hypothetical protein